MPVRRPPPVYNRWRDAEGTPIPEQCRVEQIAVSKEHGELPYRLHQHGQVVRRGPPRLLAALRFVLIYHEPTAAGRCRACRRVSWRGLWRRRRFPCVVWRQIRGELRGHLTISDYHRHRADSSSVR